MWSMGCQERRPRRPAGRAAGAGQHHRRRVTIGGVAVFHSAPDVEIAREIGQSVLWHRLLITGDPITDDLIVQLVDEVLVPFVAPRN